MQTANEFRKFIETEVLQIIKQLAEKGQTDSDRIQKIAQTTLDYVRPGMTLEELYRASVKLDDLYPELAPVVYKVMKHYEEKYERKAILTVTQYVKEKRYEDAQNLVKKILSFKIIN